MGNTETQVEEYQNRLNSLAKRDYIYLFIGLIVIGIAGLFLYTQFNPGRFFTNLQQTGGIDAETLQKTNDIAGLIQEKDINFIATSPTSSQGLSNPNPSPTSAETLTQPSEGQTSSIASSQVLNTNKTYTVQEGDNLEYIAGMMYGDREAWPMIAEANGLLENPDAIYAGMELVIPR